MGDNDPNCADVMLRKLIAPVLRQAARPLSCQELCARIAKHRNTSSLHVLASMPSKWLSKNDMNVWLPPFSAHHPCSERDEDSVGGVCYNTHDVNGDLSCKRRRLGCPRHGFIRVDNAENDADGVPIPLVFKALDSLRRIKDDKHRPRTACALAQFLLRRGCCQVREARGYKVEVMAQAISKHGWKIGETCQSDLLKLANGIAAVKGCRSSPWLVEPSHEEVTLASE